MQAFEAVIRIAEDASPNAKNRNKLSFVNGCAMSPDVVVTLTGFVDGCAMNPA